MTGQFLEKFFSDRGAFDVKPNGEADVCCPFPHGVDGRLEKNPSAHVNTEKGVFHCKTCAAQGKFSEGGMSELVFFSKIHNVSYEESVRMLADMFGKNKGVNLDQAMQNLKDNAQYMDFLRSQRGLTDETITEYKLGTTGSGIDYPVIMYGDITDIRIYNPDWKEEGTPKIRSQRGARPLLFPFDQWFAKKDTETTVICAGENDALILRQNGFNAVTTTMGEGNFPKSMVGLFKDMDVYIVYDCDEPGRQGARKVAFQLAEKGARPKIIDLGLPGDEDKTNKDVTDYFLKNGKTASDFSSLMSAAVAYTPEDLRDMKDVVYPLIDLWEIEKGEHTAQRRSSRVLNMGKVDSPMETPTAVEWSCQAYNPDNKVCMSCSKAKLDGWWTLDEGNLKEVLELVECKEDQQRLNLKRFIGIPAKCPGVRMTVRSRRHVQKVVFAPDVESENELSGYKQAEHLAYLIGINNLEEGQRYRAFYKKFPHPIQGQEIVLVVDRLETSDNALNTFQMTKEMQAELEALFSGHPDDVMKRRYENVQRLVGKFAPEMVVYAVDLTYHSVLDFRFGDDRVYKGHPDGIIIGDPRTGKSDVAKSMMGYYGVGNYTELKNGSLAGLLGGVEKMGNGGFRMKWGKIPRNHRGMLVLDELSGLPQGVWSHLTGLRSEREAVIEKIVSGKAPAKTRIITISNPAKQPDGSNLTVADYPNGVAAIRDLIGTEEDIARFDFAIMIPNAGVEGFISPLTKEKLDASQNPAYRNLIYWVWTRNAEQIKFDNKVGEYIVSISQELNVQYDSKTKLFGSEAWKKLARLSIAVAGCCFSHTGDAESILVRKEHVDWARNFLIRCYDNDVFRLPEYVEQERSLRDTNPEINALVASLVQSQPMVMKDLQKNTDTTLRMLQSVSGMEMKEFNKLFTVLVRNNLVIGKRDVIMATQRLRNAFKAWMKDHQEYRMETISERGDSAL